MCFNGIHLWQELRQKKETGTQGVNWEMSLFVIHYNNNEYRQE